MILLYFIFILIFCFILKTLICFFIRKHGKISYKDFNTLGFAYDEKKDIFYSTKNAWQKNFGYSHIYDIIAPFGSMVIDTEPIRFFYDNKNWLITFWKGQYGITTGAEIGVYYTKEKKVRKYTLYKPVEKKDAPYMCFILYKKGKEIMRICAHHWWLAGFKLGMFSKPKELSMDIQIIFPNREMLDAFLASFKKLKYKKEEYKVYGNIFFVKYKKNHTKKVWTRSYLVDAFLNHNNKRNVKLYKDTLKNIVETGEKQEKKLILNDYIPDILKNKEEIIVEKNIPQNIPKALPYKKDEKKVLLLRKDIYSNVGVCPYEK